QRAFLAIDSYGHDYGYVTSYNWYSGSVPERTTLLAHLFTDRNPYRPAETVKMTGILRQKQGEPGAWDVVPVAGKKITVEYSIKDPRGQEVAKGEVPLDDDGVFTASYTSRPEALTGYYYLYGKVKGATALKNSNISLGFQIAAYRAPEHTVTVKTEEGPWFFGKKLKTKITGTYTFGAPMADARVEWTLRRYRGYYTPPKNGAYSFYVNYYGRMVNGEWKYPAYSRLVQSGKGTLNQKGEMVVAPVLEPGKGIDALLGPGSFVLESTVYDVNRQAIAGRSTTLVHRSNLYVGLRVPRSFVKAGQKASMSFVTVDLDGKRIPGKKVTVTAYLREGKEKKVKRGRYYASQWVTEEIKAGECSAATTDKPGSCEIVFKKGGYYILKATVKDSAGQQVESHSSIYVYGKKGRPMDRNQAKTITIKSNKQKYEIGDTATIIFTSPFKNASGIYAVEQGGIVTWKHITFKGTTHTETVPITQKSQPNVNVSMVLVRGRVKPEKDSKEADSGRPKFAHGRLSLNVNMASKILKVVVTPSKKVIAPGEKITVRLKTTDFKGVPVASRLAVMVVDEGVLSLTGFQTPNPFYIFHPYEGAGTAMMDIRHFIMKRLKKQRKITRNIKQSVMREQPSESAGHGRIALAKKSVEKSKDLLDSKADRDSDGIMDSSVATGTGMGGSYGAGFGVSGKKGGGKRHFQVRKFFATTAYYNPKVVTDEKGMASLTIPMPENLTSYRIMAVAMEQNTKDRYGNGEERVKIRRRFMLRPSLPRFANYGDTFVASVVVNNQTGAKGTATVKIDGVGFQLMEKNTKTANVTQGESVEVGFLVKTLRPGRIRFRFVGYMGEATDAVNPPAVPVHIPASSEASATYGVTETSILQPVKLPGNAMPIFGGLDINLSSTALTGLQDAVRFIVDYPHECTEQIASRLVPIFALKKILDAFKLGKLSDREKREAIVTSGIARLLSTQQWDGGFTYWPGSY
ncbi:hypothetical protein KKF84_02390, partial [Myxococcota bacterium]|nr:hypothetical protein [Myxococcota bacterium]